MRVVIIGGTGHIGSYLTPRLAEAGHTVICICRGLKEPYRSHSAWQSTQRLILDRDAEEAADNFGEKIAALDPDVVIDLTCYRLESAQQLLAALRGRVQHLLHCGTIWVHGHSSEVPTVEEAPKHPFGEYGLRKLAIEQFLLTEARRHAIPVTILHPGHLVGVGWNPINPQANFNPGVFSALAEGRNVVLPNLGMETVHHVHADDVAQAFLCAIARRSLACGESFHVVSPAALTLRGFAERMSHWFGRFPDLTFLPWDQWKESVSEKDARATWDHIAHSPNCSIAKARALLGYAPRYTSLEAVQEAIAAMQSKRTVMTA
ncbi:NAD-dependent epimerase/dehydratase family protein [Edaphobacter sp. HDX4]|uniref:NAD-dependent epimerase/dehydratase family protein n=1 Tax=Edaphobacter sp. HDX4 TaxID=2794064 RepID=UPI002FE6164C